jgi:hypothetical protein
VLKPDNRYLNKNTTKGRIFKKKLKEKPKKRKKTKSV